MKETDFWKELSKAMGTKWKAERVENRLNKGFPDVVFTLTVNGVTRTGLMELKCGEPNKKNSLKLRHFTDEQRQFAVDHNSFLLVRTTGSIMLFRGEICSKIGYGQRLPWQESVALFVAKKDKLTPQDWENLLTTLEAALG